MSVNVSIKMEKDTMAKYLDIFGSLMGSTDGRVKEEMKNIIFWLTDGELKLGVTTAVGTIAVKVPAEVDMKDTATEGSTMICLQYKGIVNALSAFSGLQKTFVKSLTFDIKSVEGGENTAVLTVEEAPIDDDMPYADSYRQESKFNITMTGIPKLVPGMLQQIKFDLDDGVEVESQWMNFYIKGLSSIYSKHTGRTSADISFFKTEDGKDIAYAKADGNVVVMPNVTPLKDLRVTKEGLAFLEKFFSLANGAKIKVEDVVMNGKTSAKKIYFVADELAGYFDVYLSVAMDKKMYETGDAVASVTIDRQYFMDILKRFISMGADSFIFNLKIKDGVEPYFVAMTKDVHMEIPVFEATGEFEFQWGDKPDVLLEGMLANVSTLVAPLKMTFDITNGNKGMKMSSAAVTTGDNESRLWYSYRKTLKEGRADYNWD